MKQRNYYASSHLREPRPVPIEKVLKADKKLFLKILLLISFSIILGACVSDGKDNINTALAPAPPVDDMRNVPYDAQLAMTPEQIRRIEVSANNRGTSQKTAQCSLSKRFDRVTTSLWFQVCLNPQLIN